MHLLSTLILTCCLLTACKSDSISESKVEVEPTENKNGLSQTKEQVEVIPTLEEVSDLPKTIDYSNRLESIKSKIKEVSKLPYTVNSGSNPAQLRFTVQGPDEYSYFSLEVYECDDAKNVFIIFEESGINHRLICDANEAPIIIVELLHPEDK